MSKNIFRKEEVIAFIEDRIQHEAATEEELELYEDYRWFGNKVFKNNYTYIKVLNIMKQLWNQEY